MLHEPVEIDRTGPGSGHQPVAAQVVEPVGIERARNDGMVDVRRVFRLDELPRPLTRHGRWTSSEWMNCAVRIADDFRRPVLMALGDAAGLLHALEGMAERAVAEIMEQRRDHRHFGAPWIEFLSDAGNFPLDDAYQLARNVEDADGTGEAGVSGAGEDELGQAELFDPPQALELRRVDEPPGQPSSVVCPENDQPVDGIADTLRCGAGDGSLLEHIMNISWRQVSCASFCDLWPRGECVVEARGRSS